MKLVKCMLLLVVVVVWLPSYGQFSISRVKPNEVDPMLKDSVKQSTIDNQYFNMAKWKAERRAIRKERNTVEFNPSLQFAQTQFDNWAAGGDNTISGRVALFFRHLYRRERFSVEYKFDGRYGMSYIDSKPFKNEDFFKFNLSTGWQIRNSGWSYSADAELRSQFTKGYKSRTDKTMISDFLSPGFFNVSVGFTYRRKQTSPLKLTISPIGGNVTLMRNDILSDKGSNGVEPGRHSKSLLGPSVRGEFDKEFCKKIFRYRSSLYSFTNMKTTPTVRWENTLEIRPTKFLTTTIYGLAFYDKYANTPYARKLQLNYALTIGLAYRFVNK